MYSVKDYLLIAGICQLYKNDVVAINNALDRYKDLDPTFSRTWQYRFVVDLAAAIDKEDTAKFADAVKEYDRVTHLDAWITTLLLRVEEALKAKELQEVSQGIAT
ncbi:Alpha-soluble NSF attachment protein 2 [Striga hermonthica]|uniref:Alpha-soluble NSF attachment protein 2 n=1 Tax=Striga hermonthica TaxID=68872 RepID=A0A9N7RM64_STRHE|nr:Alpha-soluble NSF attachment protein 2 [Striga hermonthica]